MRRMPTKTRLNPNKIRRSMVRDRNHETGVRLKESGASGAVPQESTPPASSGET